MRYRIFWKIAIWEAGKWAKRRKEEGIKIRSACNVYGFRFFFDDAIILSFLEKRVAQSFAKYPWPLRNYVIKSEPEGRKTRELLLRTESARRHIYIDNCCKRAGLMYESHLLVARGLFLCYESNFDISGLYCNLKYCNVSPKCNLSQVQSKFFQYFSRYFLWFLEFCEAEKFILKGIVFQSQFDFIIVLLLFLWIISMGEGELSHMSLMKIFEMIKILISRFWIYRQL